MKRIVAYFLGVITLLAICYTAYLQYPRIRYLSYTVCKAAPDQRFIDVTKKVMVKGEEVEVTVQIPYVITRSVAEMRVREVPPSIWQILKFVILSGVAVIFGIYMLVVIAVLARDKWTQRRDSAATRDTQKRVDALVTFCTGVLVGFLGRADFAEPIPTISPNTESSSIETVISIDGHSLQKDYLLPTPEAPFAPSPLRTDADRN